MHACPLLACPSARTVQDFAKIATYLPARSVQEVVRHYYTTQRSDEFAQTRRKYLLRKRREQVGGSARVHLLHSLCSTLVVSLTGWFALLLLLLLPADVSLCRCTRPSVTVAPPGARRPSPTSASASSWA